MRRRMYTTDDITRYKTLLMVCNIENLTENELISGRTDYTIARLIF